MCLAFSQYKKTQSCPQVGLAHGLGWVEIFGWLGWVGSTIAKVIKFKWLALMHLKHQAVKCLSLAVVGWVALGPNFSTCTGSG